MEIPQEAKNLILEAKNICVIPSNINEPESLTSALALFYTLKELGKNVNLIVDNFPDKLSFLIPSLDFISQPQNFVISIPRGVADVSQIYYEKNEDNVKIHLTIDKGSIKKDNLSFYFTNAKPDAIITLGIQNFQKELSGKLDSFGFLLDAPIINIDTNATNEKFGNINMVESTSIPEIALELITSLDPNLMKKNPAECLLTGIVAHYENFKNLSTSPKTLKIAAQLMEQGANYQKITEQLYTTTKQQMDFLTEIFKHLNNENGLYVAALQSQEFSDFGEGQAKEAMTKIKRLGLQNNLLVLWEIHDSEPMTKGFFYSKNPDTLHAIHGKMNNGWVFLEMPGEDILTAKETILKLL